VGQLETQLSKSICDENPITEISPNSRPTIGPNIRKADSRKIARLKNDAAKTQDNT
jgi:hypothetical protein